MSLICREARVRGLRRGLELPAWQLPGQAPDCSRRGRMQESVTARTTSPSVVSSVSPDSAHTASPTDVQPRVHNLSRPYNRPVERYLIRGGEGGCERLALLARTRWPDTAALLARAGLSPGMRCIDLGCGGGHVTLEIARLVAPEGSVAGVDMDEIKLDLARRAAAEGGLGNVEFPHMGAGSTAASLPPASPPRRWASSSRCGPVARARHWHGQRLKHRPKRSLLSALPRKMR